MNTFGRFFRMSIFGESHGECIGILIDGCPAGLALATDEFLPNLARRRSGAPGTTTRREEDLPTIVSGLFSGRTTGAPVLITFQNKDVDSSAYDRIKTTPRPGHADLVAFRKFGGHNDHRGGGTFSGRLTAGLVAAGVIAKKLIAPVTVAARLLEAGGSTDMDNALESALEGHDSIGGLVECRADGLPAGLGEPFFDSVESLMSHLIFSIPGIKGVEFGAGFAAARMRGSAHNDEIVTRDGKTGTNNAGGINGGITNGNELVVRAAVRPTASIGKPQQTVNLETGEIVTLSMGGRHDACVALRVPVIIEAACAIVLADLMLAAQRIPTVVGD